MCAVTMLGASQVFLHLKQWSRFESWDLRITILDNLEDTSSTVSLWLPSYLISKGNLYPVCGNFEKKALNNFSQWLFFSGFAAFSVKRASPSALVLASQSDSGTPLSYLNQQGEYWDVLVNQYCCFPSLPASGLLGSSVCITEFSDMLDHSKHLLMFKN